MIKSILRRPEDLPKSRTVNFQLRENPVGSLDSPLANEPPPASLAPPPASLAPPPASLAPPPEAELYGDLTCQPTPASVEPMMLADPTTQLYYCKEFVTAFCSKKQTLLLHGPMGSGKLETVAHAVWAAHCQDPRALFVIVCATNESVQYTHGYIAQRFSGQNSLQGIALLSVPTAPTTALNMQLLICSYATLAELPIQALSIQDRNCSCIFLDAELICASHNTPQPPEKKVTSSSRSLRAYSVRRKRHTNGAIIASAPSYHNLHGDIVGKFDSRRPRFVYVANHIDRNPSPPLKIGPNETFRTLGETFRTLNQPCQNYHAFTYIDSSSDRDCYLLQLLASMQNAQQIIIMARIDNFFRLECLFQANGVQASFLSHYNSNSHVISQFCNYGTGRVLVVSERHSRLPFAPASTFGAYRAIINYDAPPMNSYLSSCVRLSNMASCHVYTFLDSRCHSQYNQQVLHKLNATSRYLNTEIIQDPMRLESKQENSS